MSLLKPTALVSSFHSDKRAHKDAHNRDKGIKKLRTKVISGKLGKHRSPIADITNFFTLSGEVTVAIDERESEKKTRCGMGSRGT